MFKYLKHFINPFNLLRWFRYKQACWYFKKLGLQDLVENRIDGRRISLDIPDHTYTDLYFLHRTLKKRKPKVALEFGCGLSTLIMADALHRYSKSSKLHVVEILPDWIEKTASKLPSHLKPFVEFQQSGASVKEIGGQLCHIYDQLPDVVPNFIYLDGPNPLDVTGEMNGLSFNKGRYVLAADPLLYEASFPSNMMMVVDGRRANCQFLRNHFKRKYKFTYSYAHSRGVFKIHNPSLWVHKLFKTSYLQDSL